MNLLHRSIWLPAVAAALACTALQAKVVTKTIAYDHDGKKMQGYLAYDDAKKGQRPAVLVVHEWWGLNDYTKSRTRQLAEMGYVAFAADMYGDGKTTTDPKEAQAWSSEVGGQQGLLASRSKAGLDVLRRQPQSNPEELAAIGFCFGGTTVLQLAYSGVPLKSTVTFHGGLVVPTDEQAHRIRATILVLHGARTFVKPETIDGLRKALDAAKVDWYMVSYANAVHAFSNPDADKYNIPGIGYNRKAADARGTRWRAYFTRSSANSRARKLTLGILGSEDPQWKSSPRTAASAACNGSTRTIPASSGCRCASRYSCRRRRCSAIAFRSCSTSRD
jgi:Dienelactone hydrolase and related enzymes